MGGGARRAVVVGAGLGGLAAAVALRRAGWEVRVLERAAPDRAAGTGLSLWPNGLRALSELGVEVPLGEVATLSGRSGVRTVRGRWIARTDIASALLRRYGRPLVLTRRDRILTALGERLGPGCVRFGERVVAVASEPGGVSVRTGTAVYAGDLAVIADGARSRLRGALFPDRAGLRYAGYTSWRMLAPAPPGPVVAAETWGRHGQRFAVLPLGPGEVYCYATANCAAGGRGADERDELRARFGRWHEPIPYLIDSLPERAAIRTDVFDLAPPLAVHHRGRAVLLGDAAHAMTPDLGQGGGQALEDAATLGALVAGDAPLAAALDRYSRLRAPRAAELIRRSRRAGRLYQAPPPVARLVARLSTVVPAAAVARALAPVLDWQPPQPGSTVTPDGGRRRG